MAWEKRGNQRYYYRKERTGEGVISEYVGRGEDAELIARIEEMDREHRVFKREDERYRFKEMRNEIEVCDEMVNEIDDVNQTLTKAFLLPKGTILTKDSGETERWMHQRKWRSLRSSIDIQ